MLGAKAQLDANGNTQCAPMRDTPWIDVTAYNADPNLTFSYFLNSDDDPNYKLSRLLGSFGALAGPLGGGTITATAPYDVYGNSNFYRNSTFFIGSPPTGCSDVLAYNLPPYPPQRIIPAAAPVSIAQRAAFWRAKADYCAASFILNHDLPPVTPASIPEGQPEPFPEGQPEPLPGTATVMERPGVPPQNPNPESPPFGTSNPLSQTRPGFAIVNDCQPLVSGDWADIAQLGGPDRARGGGAPVWRYDGTALHNLTGASVIDGSLLAAIYDEDEYMLGTYLSTAWNDYFINPPADNPALINPDQYPRPETLPEPLPEALPYSLTETQPNPFAGYATYCYYYVGYGEYCWTQQIPGANVELPCVRNIPSDSPPESAPEPAPEQPAASQPDSPSYIPPQCPPPPYEPPPYEPPPYEGAQCPLPTVPPDVSYIPAGRATAWCPNVEKILEPSNPYSPRMDYSGNDRGTYSPQTAGVAQCAATAYTDYNSDPHSWAQLNEFPVQCAIVPVDIMRFRSAAFNSCITQRIDYNMQAFVNYMNKHDGNPPPLQTAAAAAEYGPGGSVANPGLAGGVFQPPCATRFWEKDTADGCPVKMSIQQCCHIIIEDLVPANYLKLRTCEGLQENRLVNSGMNKVNIIDNGYASNPGAQGANVYITSGGSADAAYQKALADDETLNAYGCNGSSPGDNVLPKEPPEYLFSYWFGGQSNPNKPPGAPPCFAADANAPNKSNTPYCDPVTGKLVGYHMPYMRWWDTGVSAGNPRHGGSFLNALGGYDTLIGVGREERTQNDIDTAATTASAAGPETQSPAQFAMPQPAQMGRVGGWTELKEHELWTIRRSNLFCMGRYEKLFKPDGPEALVLGKAGAIYTTQGNTAIGVNSTSQQWPLGWRGYATDTHGQNFPAGFGPQGFAFQGFTLQGLGNAQAGDIIVYTIGGLPQIAYVTAVGYVKDPATGQDILPLTIGSVTVIDWDQGKFPTATGSTIMAGQSGGAGAKAGRTIWQTAVPPQNQIIINVTIDPVTGQPYKYAALIPPGFPTAGQPSCEDPDYWNCVLPPAPDSIGVMQDQWNTAQIYRPFNNPLPGNVLACIVPPGMDGGFPPSPPPPTPPDKVIFPGGAMDPYLADTYQWQGTAAQTIALQLSPLGNQGIGAALPALPPKYIFSGMSGLFPTNAWSFCVNSGYDPPLSWGSNGAGLDADTKLILCGQAWRNLNDLSTGCRSDTNTVWFFPPGITP